ncbi:opioid-binding protein/cell adhesion molecule-like [Schistocerca serialis cubense]|uniref:opioid-binding protein/cell adhesion molecule-like n=1 Tax=Schistocerca serialis cubense TaxID=2023355 RepID=UPI00214E90F9|nr:opioid-binding protein/cell adhesion molecule-like [Schistocerca serialis cubense]
MIISLQGWVARCTWMWATNAAAGRRSGAGLTCLCTLLLLAGDLPQAGQSAYINLTALGRSASIPLSMDDDSPYLRDLYWPLNDSWQLAGFDGAEDGHLIGDFLGEFHSTPRPLLRQPSGPPEPEFDSGLVTNVTAQLGATAYLHCRVKNLGEHAISAQVSWVRRRDWHILSSGLYTYTNDDRFQVTSFNNREDWTLQIQYVQKRDNGTYECQVATDNGLMSHYFNLHVTVPTAFILGNGEYHIGEGSTISLVCIIENSETAPRPVLWWHNERPLDQSGVSGVSVMTEPGPRTHSRLVVSHATRAHSGNYTCAAPDTEPDTINVYVSQGDNTAAIQKQEASAGFHPSPVRHLAASIIIAILRELSR